MQSGRGGGLTEGFAQAGEMFGSKTNEVLIRTTTILASIFFVTCLVLAILSAQRGKSLMTRQAPAQESQAVPATTAAATASTEEAPLDDLLKVPATQKAAE